MSRQRSPLRNRFEFAAYRVARAAAGRSGPAALAAIGSVLGDLLWAVGIRRGVVRFNLGLAFPDRSEGDRRRLAREMARHFGRMLLDALRYQRIGSEQLLCEVKPVGLDNAAAAADLGRGLFYLASHLGSWEVAGLSIGLLRPETLQVINRPLDNPLLEAEMERFRSRFGNLQLGKRNIARGIMRHLKDRGSVGILIDQKVPPEVGVEVPFFGHPAWTHPILARMVRRTRAPVVPLAALWEGPGRYTLQVDEPLIADDLSPDELEDEPLTARLASITEAMIRQRPGQYLWYHDRWRHLRLAAG